LDTAYFGYHCGDAAAAAAAAMAGASTAVGENVI
jgi:hypothetical protein